MFVFLRFLYLKAVLTFRALNSETVVIERLWFQVGKLRHVGGDAGGQFNLFRHVFQIAFGLRDRSMSCKFFHRLSPVCDSALYTKPRLRHIVGANRAWSTPSQLLWKPPDHLKSNSPRLFSVRTLVLHFFLSLQTCVR